MPAFYRLARARRWTPQTPGRVDRLVRRSRATHNTVALEEAVNAWLGIRPGDQVTCKVQGFGGVGHRAWRDVRLTFGGVDVTPHVKTVKLKSPTPTLDPRRYVSSHWTFAGAGDRAYLGYAWPPAGDERRPAQWPGQDDNKNRSKTMAWNAAGTIRPADLDDRVQVGADNIRDPFPDEERESEEHVQKLRERLATEQVHLLASRFLTGIREAEDLGLEVRVEQLYARRDNNEWYRTPARTERLRVGVTKQVG